MRCRAHAADSDGIRELPRLSMDSVASDRPMPDAPGDEPYTSASQKGVTRRYLTTRSTPDSGSTSLV